MELWVKLSADSVKLDRVVVLLTDNKIINRARGVVYSRLVRGIFSAQICIKMVKI